MVIGVSSVTSESRQEKLGKEKMTGELKKIADAMIVAAHGIGNRRQVYFARNAKEFSKAYAKSQNCCATNTAWHFAECFDGKVLRCKLR